MARAPTVERTTNETQLRVTLELDAPAGGVARTGHGFLDHMLEQLIRHGGFSLSAEGRGDLHVDVHHPAEDTGITLGQVVSDTLPSTKGVL